MDQCPLLSKTGLSPCGDEVSELLSFDDDDTDYEESTFQLGTLAYIVGSGSRTIWARKEVR